MSVVNWACIPQEQGFLVLDLGWSPCLDDATVAWDCGGWQVTPAYDYTNLTYISNHTLSQKRVRGFDYDDCLTNSNQMFLECVSAFIRLGSTSRPRPKWIIAMSLRCIWHKGTLMFYIYLFGHPKLRAGKEWNGLLRNVACCMITRNYLVLHVQWFLNVKWKNITAIKHWLYDSAFIWVFVYRLKYKDNRCSVKNSHWSGAHFNCKGKTCLIVQ